MDADGNDKTVATLNSGNYFGEIALLTTKPRQATVKAKGSLTVLAIDRATFIRVHSIIDNPSLPLSHSLTFSFSLHSTLSSSIFCIPLPHWYHPINPLPYNPRTLLPPYPVTHLSSHPRLSSISIGIR